MSTQRLSLAVRLRAWPLLLCSALLALLLLRPTPASAGVGTTCPGSPYTVMTETELNDAITCINSAGAGSHQVMLQANITRTTGAVAINNALATSIVIDGNGLYTLSGGGITGGFYIAAGAVTIQNLTISGGSYNLGGGIYNAGTLTVSNSTLSGNSTSGVSGTGGGIFNAGTLTVSSSTLSGNSASTGGGILNSGTLTVSSSTLSGNSAGLGGAIYSNANVTVSNSTFSGNSASLGADINTGGGMVSSSTFFGSTAGSAAVVDEGSAAALTLANNVFKAGAATFNCAAVNTGSITDGGGNVSSDATCATAANSKANTDPLLVPLASNGGPTQTHALRHGSPALDLAVAGYPAADQRGVPRPQGTGPDSGAYESPAQAGPGFMVNVTEDSDDGLCATLPGGNDCTLREAINAANAMAGANTITFNILDDDVCANGAQTSACLNALALNDCTADNVCTITLNSTLPVLTDSAMTTIDGTGAQITVSGNSSVQILAVNSGAGLTVRKLTLRDGAAPIDLGGAIRNRGTLVVRDSLFQGNASSYGGAIGGTGALDVSGSTFLDNEADVTGGAIAIVNVSLLAANEVQAAVVYNHIVDSSTFADNNARSGNGGAIYSGFPLQVTNSTFKGNEAEYFGGALDTRNDLRVENSTFFDNSARNGGGISALRGVLFNLTFAGNDIVTPVAATMEATASFGGAVFGFGAVNLNSPATVGQIQLDNSLFLAGNGGLNCATSGPVIVDNGGNVSDDATCATTANSKANTDPLLEALGDNGGPTETMALQEGSPALDFATATVRPLDQRGITRPQGSGPDSGAFESDLSTALDPCPEVVGNLIQNYCFEDGTAPWTFWTDGEGGYTTSTIDPYQGQFAAEVAIQTQGSNVQLYQKDLPLKPNTLYELSFAAYSTNGRNLSVYVHKHGTPYTNYGLNNFQVDLSTGWQVYNTTFTTTNFAATVNDARLRFWLAPFDQNNMTYRIDWVVLREVDAGNPPIPPDPPVIVPPPGVCNPPVPGNLISNPGFEAGTSPWTFWSDGQGVYTTDNTDPYECDNNAKVSINQQGSNVQLYQKPLTLQGGVKYQLRLAARSSGGQDAQLFVHKHGAPYTNYGLNGVTLDLTPAWQVFVVDFTAVGAVPLTDARLRLWLAPFDQNGMTYEFDDVVLIPKSAVPPVAQISEYKLDGPQAALRTPNWRNGVAASAVLRQGYFLDGNEDGRLSGGYVPENGASLCYNARPSRSDLFPATGSLMKVHILGIGSPRNVRITAITQDEAVGPLPDGYGVGSSSATLRRERDDSGAGRVYHIAFTATYQGQSCSHEVVVTVPLDRRTPAEDTGSVFDSTVAER